MGPVRSDPSPPQEPALPQEILDAYRGSRTADHPEPKAAISNPSTPIFRQLQRDRRRLPVVLLGAFARSMNLPIAAFFAVPIYEVCTKGSEWLAAVMRTGDGIEVGATLRSPTGDKITIGHTGLIYRDDVGAGNEPIFVVEGLSDFLTGTHLGARMIARSSNMAGARDLAALVRRLSIDPARLVIMGENDQHLDAHGKAIWPGRDGAQHVAQIAANELGQPIRTSMPPAGTKDLRDWYAQAWLDRQPAGSHWRSADEMFVADPAWHLGQVWTDTVTTAAELVHPQPARPIEPLPDGVAIEQTPLANRFAEEFANLDLAGAGTDGASITDPAVALPAKHSCPTPVPILVSKPTPGCIKVVHLAVPCDRLDCPVCGAAKRAKYTDRIKETISLWAAEHPGQGLYVWACPAGKWKAAAKALRLARCHGREAEYIAIRDPHTADRTVVSTLPSPTAARAQGADREPIETLAPEQAIARMATAISILPPERGRVSSASKWAVPLKKELPKGYTFHGIANCSRDFLVERLEHCGGVVKHCGYRGRNGITRGLMAELPLDTDLEHLVAELQAGEALPTGEIALRELAQPTVPESDWQLVLSP